MLFLYQAADAVTTALFIVLGTWALFYVPEAGRKGLIRGSVEARRTFFRLLGCLFSTWGWARFFDALAG